MKKVSFHDLKFVPASHEDFQDPGSLKKVLFRFSDLNSKTKVQMINWARILAGKSFREHYHEDMDEIFILLAGTVRITIGQETDTFSKGDAVFIPMKTKHTMENMSETDIDYIAIGLSLGKNGKTVLL